MMKDLMSGWKMKHLKVHDHSSCANHVMYFVTCYFLLVSTLNLCDFSAWKFSPRDKYG